MSPVSAGSFVVVVVLSSYLDIVLGSRDAFVLFLTTHGIEWRISHRLIHFNVTGGLVQLYGICISHEWFTRSIGTHFSWAKKAIFIV